MSVVKADIYLKDKSPVKSDVLVGGRGSVPPGGFIGQVLTKNGKNYSWADNPLRAATGDELPANPTTHSLYLIEDILKLVWWDGENWQTLNPDIIFAYDEDEEMLYLSNIAFSGGGSSGDSEMYALKSEGFAIGKQDGVPVEEGSLYYENNAKFYKEQAREAAEQAEHMFANIEFEFESLPPDAQPTAEYDYDTNTVTIGLPQNIIYVTAAEYEEMREAGTLDPEAYYAIGE